MRVDVGIGGFHISNDPDVEIKTYALGSCVALVVWDASAIVGGLIHMALPEASVNLDKAREQPGYFVDTGIPLFLNELAAMGASRKTSFLKMIGGSSILDENSTFDIGRRNILAVKKVLWRLGMGVHKEETGGSNSRTVALRIAEGTVEISNSSKKWTL